MTRPKRKAIPSKTKRAIVERQGGICLCGCNQPVEWKAHRKSTRFDHMPAIFLRPLNDAGNDYVPPQLDPAYIVARCLESDERRRSGGKARATTAGTDSNAMAKQRARDKQPAPKRQWGKRKGKKMASRPFPKQQRKFPKRKFGA